GLRSVLVLGCRQPEQQHRVHAVAGGLRRFTHDLVHRELMDAGHGAYRTPDALTRTHEQRVDELRGIEVRLGDEGSQPGRPTQPPRPAWQVEAHAVSTGRRVTWATMASTSAGIV